MKVTLPVTAPTPGATRTIEARTAAAAARTAAARLGVRRRGGAWLGGPAIVPGAGVEPAPVSDPQSGPGRSGADLQPVSATNPRRGSLAAVPGQERMEGRRGRRSAGIARYCRKARTPKISDTMASRNVMAMTKPKTGLISSASASPVVTFGSLSVSTTAALDSNIL